MTTRLVGNSQYIETLNSGSTSFRVNGIQVAQVTHLTGSVGSMSVTGSLTVVSGGITGSLTKLQSGISWLAGGGAITITSSSTGQLAIFGSAGSASTDALFWSTVQRHALTNLSNQAGNFSNGCQFSVAKACTITGVRTYWTGSAATLRFSIWDSDNSIRLGHVDMAITGSGIWTGVLTASISISGTQVRTLVATVWDTAGVSGRYTTTTDAYNAPSTPFPAGNGIMWHSFVKFHAGDALPDTNAGSEKYIMEPVITVP